MGEIILSQAGRVAGEALLPNGLSLFGAEISGAALGSLAGTLVGRAVDRAFAPDIHGPRLTSLRITESREGVGIPAVYGRGRTGGQLIWSSRFLEKRRQQSAGKGGPKVNTYSYSVSFAVAIAEGPISRLGRVWANGESLAMEDYVWRLYTGSDDQLPDPLIEAIEGAGNVPAYRGLAYIVFEDLPLDSFGNRLPQLSFEVIRAGSRLDGLRSLVKGVNVIPASGEFAYGTTIERERRFPGIERALNKNNASGASDFSASLMQLAGDLPEVRSAALTVAWFGDDLRAGTCRIRPGVETRTRASVPNGWSVASADRQSARLISAANGSANYGGTPSDTCVLEAIAAMKAEGLAVTLSPFLLMDIPPDNDLPGLAGEPSQPAFPWRGRISVYEDGTAAVRTVIDAFLGEDGGYGFRHFILHHARLVAEAGGVDAFLIGSEMTALTRLRDETGAFPFVEALITLAEEAREIVGPDVRISYAADWTEYGAYMPGDGSGDVLFPLDPLWACEDVDFVAVDWYPPLTDWRDGTGHTDLDAGFQSASDPDYLAAGLQGGEGYDWYYASDQDRDQQVRTPITDTSHGEHWIFRQKDIAGWWAQAHHERPSGLRNQLPTAWVPGSKPIWLMEIGFPAVDKGANAPNLFHDPKSAESSLPPYSTGTRDDILQRRALEVSLSYWDAQAFVEKSFVWAWDARPWPDFPGREAVWSDSPNWSLGHWLNGRAGLMPLSEMVEELGAAAGVSVIASSLPGLVEGVRLDGPMTLRDALEPLHALHGFRCVERVDGLSFLAAEPDAVVEIPSSDLVDGAVTLVRPLLDKKPGRLTLSYIDAENAYNVATVDARSEAGEPAFSLRASLPLVLSEALAEQSAAELLEAAIESETAEIGVGPLWLSLEPGDRVTVPDLPGHWLINDVTDDGLQRKLSLTRPLEGADVRAVTRQEPDRAAIMAADPEMVLIDGPALGGDGSGGPLVALAADPWAGPLAVSAGREATLTSVRAIVEAPARIGRLVEPLGAGPQARWDHGNTILLSMEDANLAAQSASAVLAGQNRLLVAGEAGWELLSFQKAELQADGTWRLLILLRGQGGSQPAAAGADAICVLVDDDLAAALMEPGEQGVDLLWKAGAGETQSFAWTDVAGLPWAVAQLKAETSASGETALSWLPTGGGIPDNWDLPDPTSPRIYNVEALLDGETVTLIRVVESMAQITDACDTVRVCEVAADGRRGSWVSIATGAP